MTTERKADRGPRRRPALFRALGGDAPPAEVEVGGICYQRREILKHDSWAATAVYASPEERIVCKFNRQQSIFGFPMKWLGRFLARREAYALRTLDDLEQVPAYRGPVLIGGRRARHAVAHVYIEGRPLTPWERVSDAFFPMLNHTIARMHERGIVYVDLHKCENILLDVRGEPHLIDFQVCFLRPASAWLARLLRPLEHRLQEMDRYHIRKHLCRNRPDIAGQDWYEFQRRAERPWWIKAHRSVARPLRSLRRRFLVSIGVRSGRGLARTERPLPAVDEPGEGAQSIPFESPRKPHPQQERQPHRRAA